MKALAILAILAVAATAARSPCQESTGRFASPQAVKASSVGELAFRRLRVEARKSAAPVFPSGTFSGKGVVIFADDQQLIDAYAAITLLRQTSSLPVELFVRARVFADAKASFASLENVKVVELADVEADVSTKTPQASVVLQSSFAEVIFMESDVAPLRDVSELFSNSGYERTGLLFFPSNYKTSPKSALWALSGAACVDAWQQDSALFVVNKEKAWAALDLARHFGSQFYQASGILSGNDDLMRFAAIAAQSAFEFSEQVPGLVGAETAGSFCAHSRLIMSPAGAPLAVQHRGLALDAAQNQRADYAMAKVVTSSSTVAPLKLARTEKLGQFDAHCYEFESSDAVQTVPVKFNADLTAAFLAVPESLHAVLFDACNAQPLLNEWAFQKVNLDATFSYIGESKTFAVGGTGDAAQRYSMCGSWFKDHSDGCSYQIDSNKAYPTAFIQFNSTDDQNQRTYSLDVRAADEYRGEDLSQYYVLQWYKGTAQGQHRECATFTPSIEGRNIDYAEPHTLAISYRNDTARTLFVNGRQFVRVKYASSAAATAPSAIALLLLAAAAMRRMF